MTDRAGGNKKTQVRCATGRVVPRTEPRLLSKRPQDAIKVGLLELRNSTLRVNLRQTLAGQLTIDLGQVEVAQHSGHER